MASALAVLGETLRATHAWFEATVGDVDEEQMHALPRGFANPISAVYVHVVVGSDFTLHATLQGLPPIIASWMAQAGVSELSGAADWHAWAARVRVDLNVFGPYASAVYGAWSNFVAALTDADLDRMVEMPRMGTRALGEMLAMQIQHYSAHCGEIACLKGLTGAVGFRPGTPDGIG